MPHLELWQWVVLAVASLLVGYSKTAIGGVGSIAVVLFAAALPARSSTGTLLPLLIAGDVTAIWVYRRHADWGLIARLLPWILVGLVGGALLITRLDNRAMKVTIAVLLLGLLAAQAWTSRRRLFGSSRTEHDNDDHSHDLSQDHSQDQTAAAGLSKKQHRVLSPVAGVGTGFATMVANASGPVMTLYLLASGYAVMELVGAAAWLYFVVNLVKVPFSIGLGLLGPGSVLLDLALLPALALGAWAGAVSIRRVSQVQFERYVLVLVAVSALLLLA